MTIKRGLYTDREKRILGQMWRAGFTDREIAADMCRSITSVESQRKRLGFIKTLAQIAAAKAVVAAPADPDTAPVDAFVARLFAAHPEGYQDGPVKQLRRIKPATQTGLPIMQSSMG